MAKTAKGKKFLRIGSYSKRNGTTVSAHCRSTPNRKKK